MLQFQKSYVGPALTKTAENLVKVLGYSPGDHGHVVKQNKQINGLAFTINSGYITLKRNIQQGSVQNLWRNGRKLVMCV